jgi:thiamine kinase-like enzyme
MEKRLIELIKKVYKKEPEEIKNITTESRLDNGSFLIKVNKQKIKAIIFSDNEELKNFLLYVPKLKRVPKILFHNKNIVFVKWLEGKSLSREELTNKDLIEIAKLQARIHKTRIKINRSKVLEYSKKAFDKSLDYCLKNKILSQEEIDKIKERFKDFFSKDIEVSLIHGDFNVDNLLKTKKGWFSIDNETLTQGITGLDFGKPVTNFCNLDENKIKTYLRAYNSVKPINFYIKDKDKYESLFLIKQIVSRHKKEQPLEKHLRVLREIL